MRPKQGAARVFVVLVHGLREVTPNGLPSLCFRMPVYASTLQCNSSRGVQHLWHTTRNEAIAKGGKGPRTLDPVPATKFVTSYSYMLYMVPSCDIVAVQA